MLKDPSQMNSVELQAYIKEQQAIAETKALDEKLELQRQIKDIAEASPFKLDDILKAKPARPVKPRSPSSSSKAKLDTNQQKQPS